LASVVVVLAAAAPGRAATTFGSTLADPVNDRLCGGFSTATFNCTSSQATLNPTRTASGGLTAPITGVIVRWRVKVGVQTPVCACTTLLTGKLRVLRANFGAGTGPSESMPLPAVGDKIYEFPVRLPVTAADRLGVDVTVMTNTQGFAPLFYTQSGGVGTRDYWTSPAPDGVSTAPNTAGEVDREVLINADVEADADGDGFGDETQDKCLGIAGGENGCLPLPALPDKIAPKLTLAGSTKQKLGSSVNVDVTCSEACSLEGSGSVSTSKPKASKALTLKRATLALAANTSGKLKLKLSKKSRNKIKRALRDHRKATATVRVTGKDAAGNVANATRKIKLRK
jgi:hypothetical protein